MAPSARRFKDGIRDLADLTKKLNGLRVVSYRYTPEVTGSSESPLEFGLIAEEVAKIFPELVVYDEWEQPLGVRYHQLVPLLLNEVQEQHRQQQMQWRLVGVMLLTGAGVTVGRWRFG